VFITAWKAGPWLIDVAVFLDYIVDDMFPFGALDADVLFQMAEDVSFI
jgi:hypothetical protein